MIRIVWKPYNSYKIMLLRRWFHLTCQKMRLAAYGGLDLQVSHQWWKAWKPSSLFSSYSLWLLKFNNPNPGVKNLFWTLKVQRKLWNPDQRFQLKSFSLLGSAAGPFWNIKRQNSKILFSDSCSPSSFILTQLESPQLDTRAKSYGQNTKSSPTWFLIVDGIKFLILPSLM